MFANPVAVEQNVLVSVVLKKMVARCFGCKKSPVQSGQPDSNRQVKG
jgi:hypothetical protein